MTTTQSAIDQLFTASTAFDTEMEQFQTLALRSTPITDPDEAAAAFEALARVEARVGTVKDELRTMLLAARSDRTKSPSKAATFGNVAVTARTTVKLDPVRALALLQTKGLVADGCETQHAVTDVETLDQVIGNTIEQLNLAGQSALATDLNAQWNTSHQVEQVPTADRIEALHTTGKLSDEDVVDVTKTTYVYAVGVKKAKP